MEIFRPEIFHSSLARPDEISGGQPGCWPGAKDQMGPILNKTKKTKQIKWLKYFVNSLSSCVLQNDNSSFSINHLRCIGYMWSYHCHDRVLYLR